jgi:linoleate 10R-lipoxygenase
LTSLCSGYFAKIVLHDYVSGRCERIYPLADRLLQVGGILGLTRDGSAWRLNLVRARPMHLVAVSLSRPAQTQQFRDSEHEMAPVGRGGAVSCEFNTLVRPALHSAHAELIDACL